MPTPVFDRLFSQALAELRKPRSLVLTAMLSAVYLVLNQFTVPVSNLLEVGFDFLAVAAIGYLCGPWLAGLSGLGCDILGYLMRPNGAYFPGFTLSAILLGILYGCWYYQKPVRLWRIVAAQGMAVLVFNFFLTPLWLHIMYGQAFVVLSGMRLVKNLIQFPISVALTLLVLKTCQRAANLPPQTKGHPYG